MKNKFWWVSTSKRWYAVTHTFTDGYKPYTKSVPTFRGAVFALAVASVVVGVIWFITVGLTLVVEAVGRGPSVF